MKESIGRIKTEKMNLKEIIERSEYEPVSVFFPIFDDEHKEQMLFSVAQSINGYHRDQDIESLNIDLREAIEKLHKEYVKAKKVYITRDMLLGDGSLHTQIFKYSASKEQRFSNFRNEIGVLRRYPVSVGRETCPPHQFLEKYLNEFLQGTGDIKDINQLKRVYKALLVLHPYIDGNGRVSACILAAASLYLENGKRLLVSLNG